MKKLLIYLVVISVNVGCTKQEEKLPELPKAHVPELWYEDPIYSQINDNGDDLEVLKSYVRAFIKDAERHGVNLSHVDVEKSILVLSSNEEYVGIGAVRVCDPTVAGIIWNQNDWNTRKLTNGNPSKLYIMWHELGHDLLGLDHICKSGHIMTGRHTPCQGETDSEYITLHDFIYDSEIPIYSFKRAADDMFSLTDQYFVECRTSISSKGGNNIPSCNIMF